MIKPIALIQSSAKSSGINMLCKGTINKPSCSERMTKKNQNLNHKDLPTKYQRRWRFNANFINELPDDTIAGDPSRQDYSVEPVTLHVGVRLRCNECGKSFDFSANEQRLWYEKYQFWIDSTPNECQSCRKNIRHNKQIVHRLSELLAKDDWSETNCENLVKIAIEMVEAKVPIGEKLKNKFFRAVNILEPENKESIKERISSWSNSLTKR